MSSGGGSGRDDGEQGRRPGDSPSDKADVEARFAALVEQLKAMPDDLDGPAAQPSAEPGAGVPSPDLTDPAAVRPEPAAVNPPPDVPVPPHTWREWSDPEVEEHFVPPDPPPLPAGDLHLWAIVLGLVGGPLLLMLANVVPALSNPLWTWLAVILGVGGVVLLVLRLPTHRDDDPTGGARV